MESFPECPGYGFTAQPQYLVQINAREGGFEGVKRRWPRPLNTYVAVPMAHRVDVEVQAILTFWHAVGGMATPFLFKDWLDFQSSPVGVEPLGTDQPLESVSLTGGGVAFQMKKLYTVGTITQERDITKPVGSTIRVFNGAAVEQTDFIVDENTGLIQPGRSFSGVPVSWGGEFNVPLRFDSQLSVVVVDEEIQGADFTLREKRVRLETANFGGTGVGGGDTGGTGDTGGDAGMPPAALALGYTTQALGPDIILDSNWYRFNFFSSAISTSPPQVVQNLDGSVTCTGHNGNGYGATICTAFHSTVGSPPHSWKGNAYGEGFYIEAVLKFPEFSGALTAESWPAFWSLAIEALTGGAWDDWGPGEPTGYGHSPEIDVFEFDIFTMGKYGVQLHDWSGAPLIAQTGVSCVTGGPVVTGASLSSYHKYGFSWVPATLTTRGVATWYFDDVSVRSYSYDQYDDTLAPPPVRGTSAGSILDARHFSLILGCSNPALPMTVKSASVWQASTAGNFTQ